MRALAYNTTTSNQPMIQIIGAGQDPQEFVKDIESKGGKDITLFDLCPDASFLSYNKITWDYIKSKAMNF